MRKIRDFEPKFGEGVSLFYLYRHFKGNVYEVLAFATSATDNSAQVVYREVGAVGKYPWVRPEAEFYQEVKNDEGVFVRRFEVVKTI